MTGSIERLAKTLALLAILLVVLLSGGGASARALKFLGPHPVAASLGGGYCYIEGPHIHAYAPDHGSLYSRVDGQLVFTADPTPFGYEGPRHDFYGNHPLPGMPDVYCYLDGPHVHPFEAEDSGYKVEHGVAFYVGPFAPIYYKERPVRARAYDVIYQPYAAARPTVTVTPPPEWHGEVWVAPPAPRFRADVMVPAPPAAGVTVTVPPPPRFDIHFGGPAIPPPVIVEPRGVYYRERHDNGRHEGWRKHDDDEDGDEHGKHWKHGGKHKHDD